jgi:hypothetical protein
MPHENSMASNSLGFPGGDNMLAEYNIFEEDQDEEEQMRGVESANDARNSEGEDDGENGDENIDETGVEESDLEGMVDEIKEEDKALSQKPSLDLSNFAADYGEQPPLPTFDDYDEIFTGMLPLGEVAATQNELGEIKELLHVAPPPILSLQQMIERQAPRYNGTLQEPSGLPYRGENAVDLDPANVDPHLRQFSDSHPVLIGPWRTQALDVPGYSASNATSPATQPDPVFSASLRTEPETPSSSPQQSRRRTSSIQSARPRTLSIPSPTYYYCYCGKKFDLLSERTKHQKYHPKMGDRRYPCQYCQRERGRVDFADLRDYHRHVFKAHPEHYTGPPPLEVWKTVRCEFCEKEYSRGDGLKRHLEKTPRTCGTKANQKSKVVASSSSLSSVMSPQEKMPVPMDNPATAAAGPTEFKAPTILYDANALTASFEAGQRTTTESMPRSLPCDMVRMTIDRGSRELSNHDPYSPDPVSSPFWS